MWEICYGSSLGCVVLAALLPLIFNSSNLGKKSKLSPFKMLMGGVFIASLLAFIPIHSAGCGSSFLNGCRVFLLSAMNAMQLFGMGCEFEVVLSGIDACPEYLTAWYLAWAAALMVLAPFFTFGVVLSLFKNAQAHLQYLGGFFKKTYIFSHLNEKALVLASDIAGKNKKALIVFTNAFDEGDAQEDLVERARKLGAILFKKDIQVTDFGRHSRKKEIYFFAIGENETENLNRALMLIERYKDRKNTRLYVFSTKVDSELVLTSADKGNIKVRRVNETESLINYLLYEQGDVIFQSAVENPEGNKHISAVIVGMGRHGLKMVKSLAWFCQMDGFTTEIHAFDRDPLAKDKFVTMAPELMSPAYNGVVMPGEAQYQITVHSGLNVETDSFAREIRKLTNATYVLVALGNDDINIRTAVNLRMYFERMKIHPVIHAIVYDSRQKKALQGIRNFAGQDYDITFIGDMEDSFSESVIIDSKLENDALARHLKWGKEAEFWAYEYNYRSSIASAIHMHARVLRGIPGADKREEDLTDGERLIIEKLEHRRWNAYMRAEGYIYSGSTEKQSRNDLGKMHHDLVDYSSLGEEEKRKDSRVGTH